MSKKYLITVSFVMFLGILFFGLRLKGYHIYNKISRINNQPGIHFGTYGIAYTEYPFEFSGSHFHKPEDLSFEIAVKPDSVKSREFKVLLVLHDGQDSKQLIIGQWRSSLIVMNGDDYANRRKIKKITASNSLHPQKVTFLTITSGKEGTKLYIDGYVVRTKKDLILNIPNESEKVWLVLGNSVYGRHYWTGKVYGLAIYEQRLTSKDVERHFTQWSQEHNFSFTQKDSPSILYLFDEKSGQRAFDYSGGNNDLVIPLTMKILKKEILVPPWYGVRLNSSFARDVIMNSTGFIPFSFFLYALLLSTSGFIKKYSKFLVVLACLLISLTIEIIQVWMPSRNSQVLDLMLNTLSGYLGIIVYQLSQPLLSRLKVK